MARRRHESPWNDPGSPRNPSPYTSPPQTHRASSSRRCSPPPTFVTEPPRLHVRETLSAEAATRLMLEKWDLMDALATGGDSAERPRGRRRKGRASSVPSTSQRPVSRVREYERWHPERERIRLAQVEMERRADEEKEATQVVEVEVEQLEKTVAKKKARDRKATPAVVVSPPVSDDEDDWRSTGRRSATTSMASTGSPPPRLDETDVEGDRERDARRSKRCEEDHNLRRSKSAFADAPALQAKDRSSRTRPRDVPPSLLDLSTPSSSRSSRRRPPPNRTLSLPASPLRTPQTRDDPRDAARDPRTLPAPPRSSRRRPRPSRSSPSPSPVRTPRSPGKSPSPPSDEERPAATDLLGAAADAGLAAVEQVGEAVSSALSRVGALFSSGKV